MTNINDYRKPDGTSDWDAYQVACVAAGKECRHCGGFILLPQGIPTLCDACKEIEQDSSEVTHGSQLRCPHCGASFHYSTDDYDLYDEGEHNVSCPECDQDFTITTSVTYSFTSPARIASKETGDD